MIKSVILVLTLVLLVAGIVPAAAQDDWAVWLYDYQSGQVVLIDETGSGLISAALPIDGDVYSPSLTVSALGDRMAYVTTSYETAVNWLFVYDPTQDATLSQIKLPAIFAHSLSFGGTSNASAFTPDGSKLAVGYSLDPSSGGGSWELLVLDVTNSSFVVYTAGDPAAMAGGLPAEFPLTPYVFAFDGRFIDFALVPAGTEGLPSYQAYRWDTAENRVEPNPVYSQLSFDVLPATGEVVQPVFDTRLPMTPDAFMFGQFNSLHVYMPQVGRFPFFASRDTSVFNPRFIQGGERILASATGTDETNTNVVIERDGRILSAFGDMYMSSAAGTPNGFIYTTEYFNVNYSSEVYLVNTRDAVDPAPGKLIYGPPADSTETGILLQIVWSDALDFAAPTTPWAQLAEASDGSGGFSALTAGGAAVQPSDTSSSGEAVSPLSLPSPVPEGGPLSAGSTARVTTTGGDPLNIRNGPGTGFGRVGQLLSGEVVTVLEGPRAADGYIWWRVSTPDGREGWAVESVDNVQTLTRN